jgi:hypothetical protein
MQASDSHFRQILLAADLVNPGVRQDRWRSVPAHTFIANRTARQARTPLFDGGLGARQVNGATRANTFTPPRIALSRSNLLIWNVSLVDSETTICYFMVMCKIFALSASRMLRPNRKDLGRKG